LRSRNSAAFGIGLLTKYPVPMSTSTSVTSATVPGTYSDPVSGTRICLSATS
jgi:hypothetical protein